MNKCYIRKVDNQAIEKQISIKKETWSNFFDDKDSFEFIGKKSEQRGIVKLLPATDPRLGGDVKKIIRAEGTMEIDDLLLIEKKKSFYILELVKKHTEKAKTLYSMFDTNDRHLEISFDEDTLKDNNTAIENNGELIGFNKIYYGIPGCGKSYKIDAMLDFKEEFQDEAKKNGITKKVDPKNIFRTTFYLDYSNADFVGQIYPVIVEETDENTGDINKKVEYKPIPGPFTKALTKAYLCPDEMVYLVVEEINRGNAAAIFGDLFQLLDRVDDERSDKPLGQSEYTISNQFIEDYFEQVKNGKIKFEGVEEIRQLDFDRNHIKLPNNLTIFATMNTSDQNVFPLDTAFKRRWDRERVVVNKDKAKEQFKDLYIPLTNIKWLDFIESVNNKIEESSKDGIVLEDKKIGAYFFPGSMLAKEDERHLNNERNKRGFNRFVNNVIDYLYADVTKFNHGLLFTSDYCDSYDKIYNKIQQYIDEYNEDEFENMDIDFCINCLEKIEKEKINDDTENE